MRYVDREQWLATNLTRKTLAIGDIITLPTFKPGETHDLLKYVNRERANASKNLVDLVARGWIRLTKIENEGALVTVRQETDAGEDLSLASRQYVEDRITEMLGSSGIIPPSSSVFTRDINGAIERVDYADGRVVTINRNIGNQITSVVDSAKGTYTIVRAGDVITGVNFSA